MSKDASGSWEWVGESYRDASGSQEDVIVICTDDGETIAVIHEPYSEIVAATARLIAAAPDLLRSLSEMAGLYTTANARPDDAASILERAYSVLERVNTSESDV